MAAKYLSAAAQEEINILSVVAEGTLVRSCFYMYVTICIFKGGALTIIVLHNAHY